jgi:hypothetical protein
LDNAIAEAENRGGIGPDGIVRARWRNNCPIRGTPKAE